MNLQIGMDSILVPDALIYILLEFDVPDSCKLWIREDASLPGVGPPSPPRIRLHLCT